VTSPTARFDGLPALQSADPVELAAALFTETFAEVRLAAPVVEMPSVDRAMDRLTGWASKRSAIGWLSGQLAFRPEVQPYLMESVLIWQQARIAGMRSWGTAQRSAAGVVLLPRGAELLKSSDPVAGLRALLT
jgi:hypothetical protein